MMPLRALK